MTSVLLGLIIWGTAQPVYSNPRITKYPATLIRQKVERYLSDYFRPLGNEYQVEWLRKFRDVFLLVKPDSIHVSHNGDKILKGNRVFKISFFKDGKALKTLYLSAKIHLFQEVFILQQTVRKNKKFKQEILRVGKREITAVTGIPLKTNENPENFIATRTLSKGRILRERDIRTPFCIRKGDRVNVEFSKAAFSIKLVVLALQDGSAGDMIWVKNPKNRKKMKVRVVAENLVKIP